MLRPLFISLMLFPLISAAPATQRDSDLKTRFQSVAHWQGYRADGKKGGTGTVDLIAPNWVITAGHVAKLTGENSDRRAEITFDDGSKASAKKVFLAPRGDVALVEIDPLIRSIKPIALLEKPFSEADGEIPFTLAGHSGGLHVHGGPRAKAVSELHVRHLTSKDDPSPGKAGDSGGAWAVMDGDGMPILFGVIHGAGVATQVGALHDWIDQTLTAGGAHPRWRGWKRPK